MSAGIRLIQPLSIKTATEGGRRILRGIATTTDEDRVGDVVEARGAVYQLPLPLLLQHEHGNPVGRVIEATVSDTAIRVVAEVAKGVGDADRAWDLVQAGLMNGLSIGFRGIKSRAHGKRGLRWESWEWFELSLVTIPANAHARILAASGKAAAGDAIRLTAAAPHRHTGSILLRAHT